MAWSAGDPGHHGAPMKHASIRPALLAASVSLALAACGGEGATSAPGTNSATQASGAGDQVTAQITGAGATFIFPLVSRWSADYNADTGHQVNYQSIGSGGGIAQIKAGTVDFGSSDQPLATAELDEAGLV